jgi:hypothetical protein
MMGASGKPVDRALARKGKQHHDETTPMDGGCRDGRLDDFDHVRAGCPGGTGRTGQTDFE